MSRRTWTRTIAAALGATAAAPLTQARRVEEERRARDTSMIRNAPIG